MKSLLYPKLRLDLLPAIVAYTRLGSRRRRKPSLSHQFIQIFEFKIFAPLKI